MDYSTWLPHLGKSSQHPDVAALLRAAGVPDGPQFEEDETSAMVELPNMVLEFESEGSFPDLAEDVGEGTGVLVGVALTHKLRGSPDYDGPPPLGLAWSDDRDTVRNKLGEPTQSDDEMCWDQWSKGGMNYFIGYSGDLSRINTITTFIEPG